MFSKPYDNCPSGHCSFLWQYNRYANQINECLVKGSPPAKKCILEILTDAVASSSCDELLKNERYLLLLKGIIKFRVWHSAFKYSSRPL